MYTKADFCGSSTTGPNGYAKCPQNCRGTCYYAIERFQKFLSEQFRSKQRVSTKNINIKKTSKRR